MLKFFHWTLDIVKRFKTYTIFPHIVFAETILFEFGNPKVTVHKCAETIQGRKLYEEIRYKRNVLKHETTDENKNIKEMF